MIEKNNIERPFDIGEELEVSDIPFFMYGIHTWDNPEFNFSFKICYRENNQVILPNGSVTISSDDLKKIKDIVVNELWILDEIGEDYTREPNRVIMDGCENIIYLNYNGNEKELSCWNLWKYLDDAGLSPSADKLLSVIDNLNSILSKYDIKLEIKK